MSISDERREVAAKLRALPIDTYAARKEWEEGGLFIDANLDDEADYSQIHNAVFGCFPAEYMYPVDYEELHDRLADLIDPTCHDLGGEEGTNFDGYDFGCSECGYACDLSQPNYCPNCGARVVTDDGE